MHIIDRGKHYPSQHRYALGREWWIDGERVEVQTAAPRWYHLEMIKTEAEDQIIEMEEDDE